MALLKCFRSVRWIAATVLVIALAFAGASVMAAVFRPVLRVGTHHAIRGSHFKAHELIRVVFTSNVRQDRRRVRLVHASAAGSFSALVPSLNVSCAPLQIRARGSSGDVAALALSRGLCPPPSASGKPGAGTQPPQTGTLPDPNGPPTINPASGTQGAGTQPPTGTLPDPNGPPTIAPASGTHSAGTQPPQTGTLPGPNGPPTIDPASGTHGAGTQPPQPGTLPDPHGPATFNPG